ncbi:MAG TPA: family 78 glycoside hydrolase catalytic domain [Mycobacteriales bacterium]|nr:family 78 glycoside hydrolase catalytic domain [Mycobacteriales bacterium]
MVLPRLTTEFERAVAPVGAPRLSWIVDGAPDGWRQHSYELRLGEATYDVESRDSVLVPWPAPPLRSRQRVDASVRVKNANGELSDWSAPVVVEAGLLEAGDWTAEMIGTPLRSDESAPGPVWLFRRELDLTETPISARLYISAHGVFQAEIDGIAVSDELFAPGWSAYRKRLRVCAYDVTHLVAAGRNAIGVAVADGWWRGYLGGEDRRAHYGERIGLIAQLEVETASGRTTTGTSSHGWRVIAGPTRSADFYMGETFDARRAANFDGWSCAGFDDDTWAPCEPIELDRAVLVCHDGPPVRRTEEVVPVAVSATPSGASLVDYGQNLVGRVRLAGVSAAPGTEIVLRHAEVLTGGELCTEPLRSAKQTDSYIASGVGEETWEPEFTFHGFRYAEVRGLAREPEPSQVAAQVCHSDMRRTGWFTCSEPLLERLHENAVWSMRGNFVDVPTDCPQRDERLGWTGDIQVFAPTACFLYDCRTFLSSWLADLAADQMADGGIPFIVPNPRDPSQPFRTGIAAAWADAAVIVPSVLYERFGDVGILGRQLPSMTAFVDACRAAHGPRLNGELFQFGDWLDPAAPADDPAKSATDPVLIAGAYLVRSLSKLATACRLVGRQSDSDFYGELAGTYRQVWQERFYGTAGRLTNDTVTAHAIAITFGLLPGDAAIDRAGERLRELCDSAGHHIATGFVGTPLVCDALTQTGNLETAYKLLLQTECPSWLYPVTRGATTIWERWDSLRPDGQVNAASMTSFNHYALGAVVDWMHRVIGGLSPDEPGYRAVLVAPRPGGGLTSAGVSLETGYGTASVAWQLDGQEFSCDVEVAPNTTATLDLPIAGATREVVGSGRHRRTGRFAA